METAQQDYSRQRTLLGQGYVAKADVESSYAKMSTFQANYQQVMQRQKTMELENASAIRALSARVQAAQDSIDAAKAKVDEAQASLALAQTNKFQEKANDTATSLLQSDPSLRYIPATDDPEDEATAEVGEHITALYAAGNARNSWQRLSKSQRESTAFYLLAGEALESATADHTRVCSVLKTMSSRGARISSSSLVSETLASLPLRKSSYVRVSQKSGATANNGMAAASGSNQRIFFI